MKRFILVTYLLYAGLPGLALADTAAAKACAGGLSPAAQQIYRAVLANPDPSSSLPDRVRAQTRSLVMAGALERAGTRSAAEAAGACLKLTRAMKPEIPCMQQYMGLFPG